MRFCFRWVREDRPGPRWLDLFRRAWPGCRAWYFGGDDAARPDVATSRRALGQHMPELVPLWEELVELSGGGDEVARMLGLFRPPVYLSGCSQAVWSRGAPMLVRNYDYDPRACEGTFLRSSWTGTAVMAATDCLWGVLDGINEHGLVVALAFGGRKVVGDGFGIPIILRYVLETCGTAAEAIAVLRRVPSHMAYNVSVLDRAGERAVVFVAPDREALTVHRDVTTNHQRGIEWERYDRLTRSTERLDFLEERLHDPALDAAGFVDLFLRPPLFRTDYQAGFGTIYTVSYAPEPAAMVHRWRATQVEQTLAEFEEGELVVPLVEE